MSWSNYMTATRNAISAFKLTLANPGESAVNDLYADRTRQYALGWNIYTNQAFNALGGWSAYAATEGLYVKTRPIYNPATVIVDFYAAHIYQGVLSEDGRNLPEGAQLAIPLSRDTPPELKAAIGQLWQWGNWQQKKAWMVTTGAAKGDVFLEAVEDFAAGRVWPQVVQPEHIRDIEFDPRGNITYYDKQYSFYSRVDKRSFRYRKVVTRDTISTYRDDNLFDYDGNGAERDNDYGFVPLVYNAHRATDSLPGAPAVRNWNKIELLNSLATRVDAYIRVQSQSPNLISGGGKIDIASVDATKNAESDLKILKVDGENVAVHPLTGNLDISAAEERIKSMLIEVEHDHPEATMYSQLRSMGEVTGVAAEILMGDVKGHIQNARAGYDSATIRVHQMCVSIGGMRLRESSPAGGWRNPTDQQKKFSPYDLNSYARGLINFDIDDRPLVAMTPMERAALKTAQYGAIQAGIAAEQPVVWQMEQDGAEEADIRAYSEAVNAADMLSFGDKFPAPKELANATA